MLDLVVSGSGSSLVRPTQHRQPRPELPTQAEHRVQRPPSAPRSYSSFLLEPKGSNFSRLHR